LPEAREGSGGTAGTGGEDDEREELQRLRAEVRELREREVHAQEEATVRRRGRWRAPVAALLITLGCILAPVAVLGIWAGNQVSNTDRYVANMAPLISEPSIQQALSDKITARITTQIDAKALTTQAAAELQSAHLPRLSALVNNFSDPIANGVNGFIATTVSRVVASPAMATVWVQANRAAHASVVKVLSGEGNGAVAEQNGQVVLQLGPLIAQVKQRLIARGLTVAEKIPTVNATFPLFEAPNLAKAQQGYRLINTLKWVLPFLALALMAAGIFVSRGRRRGLLGAALGLSASMLVLAIALAIARTIYLRSVPTSTLPPDAAAALYDTLVRFIKDGLRVLLLVGLVVAVGAFLTGPAAAAVWVRGTARKSIDWTRGGVERAGLRTGPVGEWVADHKTVLRVCAVAVAALVFVFWGTPSLALVIWLVVLLLVVLGLIELLGGRSAPSAKGGTPGAAGGAPAGAAGRGGD
jgi:hypothetical protein